MIYSLREFLENIIYESLHPELQSIVTQKTNPYGTSKQAQLTKKIKELTAQGERTGIEGNMPKGSSRAYLPIKEKALIRSTNPELNSAMSSRNGPNLNSGFTKEAKESFGDSPKM